MDRWSSSFSINSLKGITSPVWIRFLGLPLSCSDEENIPMIASMIGSPMMLDENSLKWSKREYARCCVRIDLEKKLPRGVWIEGIHGRTFQRVEYEKLYSLCYCCGKVGHSKDVCPDAVIQIKEKMTQDHIEVLDKSETEKRGVIMQQSEEPVEPKKQNQNMDQQIDAKSEVNLKKSVNLEDKVNAGRIHDIPIGINKFQALEEDLEEGELNEEVETRLIEKMEPPGQKGSNLGARKKETARYLREIVKDNKGFFIGLTETKMSSLDGNDINQIMGTDLDYFHQPANGVSGGILVMWKKDTTSFEVLNNSSQLIMGILNVNNMGKWNIVTVYGSNDAYERKPLWQQLEECMIGNDP
ncbi:uncharacterized protein LOC110113087 [Dendrobium catenatum]|uniref:uncharacterized protein LOC110113087 n=1 Tax=Dendrobium catenatum TaxID=906689 RepID=UPI0009F5B742|nr:uncharacterized protein LOC110113087 [Dendrobium catenatum]